MPAVYYSPSMTMGPAWSILQGRCVRSVFPCAERVRGDM